MKFPQVLIDQGYRYCVKFTDCCSDSAYARAMQSTKFYKNLNAAIAYKYRRWEQINDGFMQPEVVDMNGEVVD